MSRIAVVVGFVLLGIAFLSVRAGPKAPAPEAPKVVEKPLPEAVHKPRARYIGRILARVEVPPGATLVDRNDHVEITTNKALRKRIWGKHPCPYLPLVHGRFEKKPLTDVLKSLAEQSEHN